MDLYIICRGPGWLMFIFSIVLRLQMYIDWQLKNVCRLMPYCKYRKFNTYKPIFHCNAKLLALGARIGQ